MGRRGPGEGNLGSEVGRVGQKQGSVPMSHGGSSPHLHLAWLVYDGWEVPARS